MGGRCVAVPFHVRTGDVREPRLTAETQISLQHLPRARGAGISAAEDSGWAGSQGCTWDSHAHGGVARYRIYSGAGQTATGVSLIVANDAPEPRTLNPVSWLQALSCDAWRWVIACTPPFQAGSTTSQRRTQWQCGNPSDTMHHARVKRF